jgi:hypothetical protein
MEQLVDLEMQLEKLESVKSQIFKKLIQQTKRGTDKRFF